MFACSLSMRKKEKKQVCEKKLMASLVNEFGMAVPPMSGFHLGFFVWGGRCLS